MSDLVAVGGRFHAKEEADKAKRHHQSQQQQQSQGSAPWPKAEGGERMQADSPFSKAAFEKSLQ